MYILIAPTFPEFVALWDNFVLLAAQQFKGTLARDFRPLFLSNNFQI
jgi:hypothetical protein